MTHYISIDGIYIVGIGRANNEFVKGNATEAEYNEILDLIRNKPSAPEGFTYRLKTDLTWELYELPPMPEDGEATIEDYEAALAELGVR